MIENLITAEDLTAADNVIRRTGRAANDSLEAHAFLSTQGEVDPEALENYVADYVERFSKVCYMTGEETSALAVAMRHMTVTALVAAREKNNVR